MRRAECGRGFGLRVESTGEVTPVSSREGRLAKHGLRLSVERRVVLASCPVGPRTLDCGGELRALVCLNTLVR